jgi:hypothetical protein
MPKAKHNISWTFTQKHEMLSVFRFDIRSNIEPVKMLCLADLHWDNPKCDRKFLKKVLDEAVEQNAPIGLFGDTFCAMQGKYDRRSSKNDVRPEHQKGDYFDALVRTAAEWFEPYKNHLCILSQGNHESSVYERHETDLLDRLAYKLRDMGGIAQATGYHGFIQCQFSYGQKHARSHIGYYHHGFGGGGPVTKGVIDFNRYAQQVRADFYLAGHIHRVNADYSVVLETDEITGIVRQKPIDFVRMGSFKEEGTAPSGWHVERGMGPRPMGGWWAEFHLSSPHGTNPDFIAGSVRPARCVVARRRFVRAI